MTEHEWNESLDRSEAQVSAGEVARYLSDEEFLASFDDEDAA